MPANRLIYLYVVASTYRSPYPLRHSVKSIYDAKQQGSAPHESMIADVKKLMQFIEKATPNPSINRTA